MVVARFVQIPAKNKTVVHAACNVFVVRSFISFSYSLGPDSSSLCAGLVPINARYLFRQLSKLTGLACSYFRFRLASNLENADVCMGLAV
jgi:hypothetical protein